MKTLAVILHYNTFHLTDQLYEMLKPYERTDYDLVVIDNGSEEGKTSKYANFRLDENVYFGGGLNAAFEYVLESKEYDSLLFLNSDLIVHGEMFVKSLRNHLSEYDIITPCVFQPEKIQNHWKQMWNWGQNKPREVKWIDLQAPLFSRKFIEKAGTLDELLIYGWGIDVLFGIIGEKENMKTCVVDSVPTVHLGSATLKQMKIVNEYCQKAETGQWSYFQRENLITKAHEFRNWAENYEFKT